MKTNRTVTIQMPLSEMAKNLEYVLEADSYEDVYHDGYSKKDVRKMDLRLSSELEDVNKVFPSVVGQVMEDLERNSYADNIVKKQIEALKESLLKIDLTSGGAEYQDINLKMVSEKAGILSVDVDVANDMITMEILNPEHLINAIVHGVGRFHPDLSSEEPESMEELKQRMHHLNDFFEVWGVSKASGELSSQFSPDYKDEDFYEQIKERIAELTIEEVAEAVRECVKDLGIEPVNAVDVASKLVSYDRDSIKKAVIESLEKTKEGYDKLKDEFQNA